MKKGLYFYRRNFILINQTYESKIFNSHWFVLGCCFSAALAQTISVKGTVTDESKLPMPGVSVVVKGTTHGTSTDIDGKYELQAKAGDVLEFSSVGYTTQTKKVVGGG